MVARYRLSIAASEWSTILNANTNVTCTQRTRRRELDWQRRQWSSLLRTQLILEEDAIDARCFPVERCWTETFLSQMLRRWGMTSIARRLNWTLFSAVDRISLAKRWFCVKIWRRAASLMLRRGPCGCFIELCAVTCTDCCLSCLRHLSRWDTLVCQIAARHFTEAKYLTESGSKDQRNVGYLAACTMDLWRRWIWHDYAIIVQAFPTVWLLRGHTWSRKMRFFLLSKFYLNRSQMWAPRSRKSETKVKILLR